MTAYAIAHLHNPTSEPDVFEYLERIDATLEPYSGRFLIHGGGMEVLEGTWPGAVVVLEFPGVAEAKSWYRSAAYQAILPLRTRHIASDVILAEGVEAGHNSAELAATLRQTARACLRHVPAAHPGTRHLTKGQVTAVWPASGG